MRAEATEYGLNEPEGAFLWCSFWLARNLLRMGRIKDAKELYERITTCPNHVGLLAEMVAPSTGEFLGNMPQALTHLGVIVTGLELANVHTDTYQSEEENTDDAVAKNLSESR